MNRELRDRGPTQHSGIPSPRHQDIPTTRPACWQHTSGGEQRPRKGTRGARLMQKGRQQGVGESVPGHRKGRLPEQGETGYGQMELGQAGPPQRSLRRYPTPGADGGFVQVFGRFVLGRGLLGLETPRTHEAQRRPGGNQQRTACEHPVLGESYQFDLRGALHG